MSAKIHLEPNPKRRKCYDCGKSSTDWVYARRANGQDVTHFGVTFTYDYYPVCNSRRDCMKRRGIEPQEHPAETQHRDLKRARAARRRRLHPRRKSAR